MKHQRGIIAACAAVALAAAAATLLAACTSDKSKPLQTNAAASPSASSSLATCVAVAESHASAGPQITALPPTAAVKSGKGKMQLATDLGLIEIEFDRAKTPCTAAFLGFLSSVGYYDNHKCHRVATGNIHIVQCGDPTGTGLGSPGFEYAEEDVPQPTPIPTPSPTCGPLRFPVTVKDAQPLSQATPATSFKPFVLPTNIDLDSVCFGEHGRPSEPVEMTFSRGMVGMAHTGAPDTTGAQFFFVTHESLIRGAYTPFGNVTRGMDILDKVYDAGTADRSSDGKPKRPLRIVSVTFS